MEDDIDAYTRTFASINALVDFTSDDFSIKKADVEEYIRNYIPGYSNRMPMRFYNSFRSIVHGKVDATAHSEDGTNASEVDRIYAYSVEDFFKEFGGTEPNDFIGQYIDDNFIFHAEELDTGKVLVNDLNDTWLTIENGDKDETNIKSLISVSGMPYLTDDSFYSSIMEKNYVRVKMKFLFSRKAGRWLTLDYRQFPTSYLTPTFGNKALSYKEKSIVYENTNGNNIDDYVPFIQPTPANIIDIDISETRNTGTVTFSSEALYDSYSAAIPANDFIVYEPINENNPLSAPTTSKNIITKIITMTPNGYTANTTYTLTFDTYIPSSYANSLRISIALNTIDDKSYPYNPEIDDNEKNLLWKRGCDDNTNMPYYKMKPMEINRFCMPFLSDEFPYDTDGDIIESLYSSHDYSGNEDYRFKKLIDPVQDIDFVVPNNLHGGKTGFNKYLCIFTPHMWKVYWNIRPAVSAMLNTDIPSKINRTGGVMADPVLNSMFSYPDLDNLLYSVPSYYDMSNIFDTDVIEETGEAPVMIEETGEAPCDIIEETGNPWLI